MIAWLRLGWTGLLLFLLTVPLGLYQVPAFRSGRLDITRAPQLWYRIAARIFRFRIVVHGSCAVRRPLLIAANHVSWTDVMVLGSLLRGSFVAKAEVARWPIVGPLSKLQGTILVERERRNRAGAQVGELGEALRSGRAVILFAEGTTSDGTVILPFKSTLFAAAQPAKRSAEISGADEAPIWVQPVAIRYTRMGGLRTGWRERRIAAWIGDEDLFPHLMWLLGAPPLDVTVSFGEPILFGADANRKQVARLAEERVRAMVTAIDRS